MLNGTRQWNDCLKFLKEVLIKKSIHSFKCFEKWKWNKGDFRTKTRNLPVKEILKGSSSNRRKIILEKNIEMQKGRAIEK